MKKRILTFLLITALVFSIGACTEEDSQHEQPASSNSQSGETKPASSSKPSPTENEDGTSSDPTDLVESQNPVTTDKTEILTPESATPEASVVPEHTDEVESQKPEETTKPAETTKPNNDTTEHRHTWGEWKVTTPSTCTKEGVLTRTCSSCSMKETSYESARGHDMSNNTCKVCGYSTSCKHSSTSWKETKKATCTEDGTKSNICSSCSSVISTQKIPALGHSLTSHAAKAATCTQSGNDAYKTCSRCSYSTYKKIDAKGHNYVNGTCTSCGAVKAGYIEEIKVPATEKKSITIDKITQKTLTIPDADIITYQGNITIEDQVDKYSYTVPYDGRLRIELSEVYSGNSFEIYVLDRLNEVVDVAVAVSNGDGITLTGLKKSETYQIKVCQYKGFSSYVLSLGQQKETKDVSNCTIVNDKMEFTDQRNVYSFKPSRDGRYRFEISGMQSGMEVELCVFNRLGEQIGYSIVTYNGDGETINNLLASETYQIQVRQRDNIGKYMLNIGLQKETVNISNYTEIKDNIEFYEQKNRYTFKPEFDGNYRFEISGMQSGMEVEVYIFNSLDEQIGYSIVTYNGDGETINNLLASETYQIQVRQREKYGSYTLTVGKQKKTVDISSNVKIVDSIQFEGQKNLYYFVADAAGDHNFTVSNMNDSTVIGLYILNEFGETVSYDDYYVNGNSISLDNVNVGEKYTIVIKANNGIGSYTLTIK